MSYASANTEVKAHTGFSNSYSSTTQPTLTEVETFISQIEGEINGILISCGITLPPANTNLLKILSLYESFGAAGLVLARYGRADDANAANWYYNKYQDWKTQVINDKDYKSFLIGLEQAGYTGDYISSQVLSGDQDSDDISYIDEGLQP